MSEELKPHEQRVIEEKKQLDEKIEKLEVFVKTNSFFFLPLKDMQLLQMQRSAMDVYARILDQRIEKFQA